MTLTADNPLIGRWRIIEADLWDNDHLDLVEPAYISFADDGRGEISFGALNAGLDCEYGARIIFFTWFGCDEMDEVMGSGNAELNDDGTIDIEFSYHLGDDALLKARRWCVLQQPARPDTPDRSDMCERF